MFPYVGDVPFYIIENYHLLTPAIHFESEINYLTKYLDR